MGSKKESRRLSAPALLILTCVLLFNLAAFPHGLMITLFIGVPVFIAYGIIADWENRGIFFYLSVSTLLVFLISHLHYVTTDPCRDSKFFCHYYYGFPISFYLVSNNIYAPHFILGILAFILDVLITLVLLKGIVRIFSRKH